MLGKWKRFVDRCKVFGALLTDLSKAFDCLNHDLLIAKLKAYGFSLPALRLIHDYLLNRKQRTGINNSYSTWVEIVFGVPQGSILGPLLFNIFHADLFFIANSMVIANYADDNMPYATANDIDSLLVSLEEASKSLFTWFDNNLMKSNAGKCQLLVSSNEKVTIKIGSHEIANTNCEKLLDVHLDSCLSFDYHVSEICALARVTSCMSLSKKRSLMNAFFNSQFNYCPLIWMCHSRENNNKVNRLHERCLRIIYNDKRSSFNALLEKDGSASIHERNIKILATEMFKVSKNLAPSEMQEIFKLKDKPDYNLRYSSLFFRPLVKSVYKGTASLSFLGPKIWDILPDTYRDMLDLNSFKLALRRQRRVSCPCRICKVYMANVGFA